jgi:membrane protease YdiL (CAAX protease family)
MKTRAVFLGQSILLILLVTVGGQAVARFLKGLTHDRLTLAVTYYALVTMIALSVVAIGSLLTRTPAKPYRLLGFSWTRFSLPWFLAMAALWLLPNVINPLLGKSWKMPEIGSAFFIAIILAPVLEEVIFRGCLQGSLHDLILACDASWRRIALVILIQSLTFSLAHFDLLQPHTIQPIPFAVHFLGGVSLGFLAYRTGSVWPGAVVHFIGNLSAAMNG